MNGNFQLFKPSGSAGAATSDFVKDAFQDISMPANSNTGLSSTISTNPLGGYYANDDAPKFGVKTLWIKDLVLIEDRSKWQDGQPTYRVVFHEQFPGVDGYVFGAPFLERGMRAVPGTQLYQPMNSTYQVNVGFRNFNGGMGVTGKIRRVMWLTTPNDSGSGGTDAALVQVDGVSGATIAQNASDNSFYRTQGRVYAAAVHASSNETNDLHDYRLINNGLSADSEFMLKITGVVVYFENSGANIECFPGTTYVDKAKKTTLAGASLALPSFGASLGGRSLIYKDSVGAYQITSVGHTPVVSVATGSSGTNLLTVTTGHGASFSAGMGIIAMSGTSHYVGVIQSISTDTFTVGPTLPIGVSGDIYPYYLSSVSAPISATLYGGTPAFTFGATTFMGATTGASISFWADPYNRYYLGINQMYYGGQYNNLVGGSDYDRYIPALFPGQSYLLDSGGNVAAQGRCSAADIEWYSGYSFGASDQILQYHVLVDGITTIVQDTIIGQTTSPRYIKHTLLTDGGPQWHQFNIVLGQSHGPQIGIAKINFYDHAPGQGVTFGHLATFDTMQAVASPDAGSSLWVAPGVHQRYMADSLYFKGGMARSQGQTTLGANSFPVYWTGGTSNDRLEFQWYGKDIMIRGINGGASLFISIDGVQNTAGVSLFNSVIPVSSQGFHSLVVEYRNTSFSVGAVDVWRSHGEVENVQTFTPVEQPSQILVTDWTPYPVYIARQSDGNILAHSNVRVKGRYKVLDDEMTVEIICNFLGTFTPDGAYTFSLPTEYAVDYKREAADGALTDGVAPAIYLEGVGALYDAGNQTFITPPVLYGSQYVYPSSMTSPLGVNSYFDGNRFNQPGVITFAAGDYIYLKFKVTIVKPGT